jgi:hypothetical protein
MPSRIQQFSKCSTSVQRQQLRRHLTDAWTAIRWDTVIWNEYVKTVVNGQENLSNATVIFNLVYMFTISVSYNVSLTKKQCMPLAAPDHSSLTLLGKGFECGDNVSYSCDKGYITLFFMTVNLKFNQR